MKRSVLLLVLFLTACGGSDVLVETRLAHPEVLVVGTSTTVEIDRACCEDCDRYGDYEARCLEVCEVCE